MAKKRKRKARSASNPEVLFHGPTSVRPTWVLEVIGCAVLLLLLLFFLTISWRKWPDPLVDFGRELYLPWRISQGAVLYRDLEGHYGPLSQYFNGLIFATFGPGLMILVTVNLLVLLGILILLYLLSRQAWGASGAFSAVAIFISVFGFSQLTGIANYNYATPYAHETTHGLLVSLALTFVLVRWVKRPGSLCSFYAGLLYGLCFVLKPEFILAGAFLSLATLFLRWLSGSLPKLASIGAAFAGVILPTLAFAAYFATLVAPATAFTWATQAWLRFVIASPKIDAGGIQAGFSGTENAGSHLAEHAVAVMCAAILIGVLIAIGWLIRSVSRLSLGIAVTVVASAVLAWFSWSYLNWLEVGGCLLGLVGTYIVIQVVVLLRRTPSVTVPSAMPRLLLLTLAAAMMARMAFNGRIYHYGFYQAALAGSLLPAILVGELPEWLHLQATRRWLFRVVIAALIAPGIVLIARNSRELLDAKTYPIGDGIDRFYSFARQIEPTGEVVDAVTNALEKMDRDKGLVVLPEGIMINYLTRSASTVPGYFFASTGPQLMAELEAHPPEHVVLISRDLREYGIERYGEKSGQGREILLWLSQHYRQIAQIGGNPLDHRQRGAVIFRRKNAR